jgi:hypothetical protein
MAVRKQNPSWVRRERRLTQKDGGFLDLGRKKGEERGMGWEVYRERNYRDWVCEEGKVAYFRLSIFISYNNL